MRVAVIGAGYVGLPLCLHLAKAGHRVTAVDVDERIVRTINDRSSKVEEIEDFERFFRDPDVLANLSASMTPVEADAYILAVPTPVHSCDKTPNLGALTSAAGAIVPFMRKGVLVVVESTIPPNTTRGMLASILGRSGCRVGEDVLLAHCPERILPGNIMAEAVYNPRVIGGINSQSTDAAAQLYGSFVKGKLHLTDDRTAEFVKLIENTYRDVNIAFANQVSILAEALGVDAFAAIELANEHPRVEILKPGIGVGGHCIPIDPWFLVDASPALTAFIRSARDLNDSMPRQTARRILECVHEVEEPKVVCLGATYKPNVRDVRESPAFEVVRILKESIPDVLLYDPLLADYACDSVLSVARGSDALAILVPHDLILTELRYRRLEILSSMRTPNIVAFSPGV
jgi:UDP-N-acetyl-D-mannosaminuronic acid dehydrogenase